MEAVTEEDIVSVARTLIRKAKGGNVEAIKALFDRASGRMGRTGAASQARAIWAKSADASGTL